MPKGSDKVLKKKLSPLFVLNIVYYNVILFYLYAGNKSIYTNALICMQRGIGSIVQAQNICTNSIFKAFH